MHFFDTISYFWVYVKISIFFFDHFNSLNLVISAGWDLEEVGQTRQHVGGDGWDVVDTLTVFQKDPDQQQNRPEQTEDDFQMTTHKQVINILRYIFYSDLNVLACGTTYPTTAYFCPLTSRKSVGFLSFGPEGRNTSQLESLQTSQRPCCIIKKVNSVCLCV